MKLKSFLLAGLLCCAGNSFLGAKTRIFTVDKPVLVGNYKLAPGTYRMRVKGDTCEITDLNHYGEPKPIKVTARTTKGDERFRETVVRAENDGDVDRATQIELRHSRELVSFQ
jgi:hypothetical protein